LKVEGKKTSTTKFSSEGKKWEIEKTQVVFVVLVLF